MELRRLPWGLGHVRLGDPVDTSAGIGGCTKKEFRRSCDFAGVSIEQSYSLNLDKSLPWPSFPFPLP